MNSLYFKLNGIELLNNNSKNNMAGVLGGGEFMWITGGYAHHSVINTLKKIWALGSEFK